MSARSTGAPVNFWQDVPNLVSTQVGDNPEYADTLSLWSCQVRVFEDDNYGGSSVMFDPFAGDPSLNQTWPDGVVDWGVSSLRIWPLQHRPHAGYTASYYTGIIPFDGQVYTLEGTISGHTADSITIYFEGQTSTTDPGGPELWSLDNVQVTLEQDETSIPLTDQSFTVSAWAKQVEPGQPGAILSQGIRNTNQGLHFAVRDSSAFTCAFYGDDLNTSDASLMDAEWHHWVCTYDAVSKTRTLYRDGIQVAQDQASANYQGLGETHIGSAFGADWFFNGEIDEVATWREALTADDVVDLYNKVKVQDQSVMVGTIFAATGTASFNHSEVTLRETATDVGDIAQTNIRTLTVDADAPQICQNGSQCPIADQYVRNTGTLVVAGTAEDPTSYISAVDVNDGGWQPATGTATWSYGWNISALGDGEHTLPVRATDAVGHVSSIYNLGVVIDSTPPQATFATGDGAVQRPTRDDTGHWRVSLAGNVTDPLAGSKAGSGVAQVDVLLDGAGALAGQGWQPATIDGTGWTIDYVLPGFDATSNVQTDPTGSYTVTLRATDAISNTTPAGAYPTTQSRLDAAGPTIVATAPLSNTQLITTALTILGTAEDASPIAGVEVNFTPAEQIEALNGALVYHAFDEDQASQYFDDQSGSNNAAVCDLVACPQVGVAGQRDRAVRLNGVNQSLTIADNAAFDFGPDDDFTVAFWVKADATQPDTARSDHSIVEKWSNTGGGYPFVVRYLRATGQVFGARYDKTHGPTVTSVQSINDGQFHHVAFVKKAGYLYLYVDGEQSGNAVLDTTTGNTANAYPIYLGMRGGEGGTNHFAGTLDELLIYGRALADYEIDNLVAYGQGTWNAATVAGGGWSFVVPEGNEGIEGLYQINVRGTDALGNVTPLGGQRLWRGEIDTKPPVLQVSVATTLTGSVETTTFTCRVTDFNLDLATSCAADNGVPTFRPGDETLTTYDEVDAWYAANITDTSRLYAVDALRMYTGTQESGRVTACDLFGRCVTQQADLSISPPPQIGSVAVEPASGQLLTKLAPIYVNGHAFDANGLGVLFVKVNDKSSFFKNWQDGETESPWRFMWTPPGEGVYRFTPLLTEYEGAVPLRVANDAANEEESSPTQEVLPEVNSDELPYHIHLPLIAQDDGIHRFFLPLLRNSTVSSNVFTGTAVTLLVDLTPPTIDIESTVLTSTQRLGNRVVELSGPVADATQLHTIEVQVNGGPWDLAGIGDDGRWRYPWILAAPADGERHLVTVRATDVAGRSTEVTKEVTVDIAPPTPGPISYAYVKEGGETVSMQPGDRLTDTVALVVTWGVASEAGGDVRYLAGFSRRPVALPRELTEYGGPGSHAQAVANGDHWYAIVRYVDDQGNDVAVNAGPFFIGAAP